MPTRRSKNRQNMLAEALRGPDGGVETMKSIAEFTEPYGTISAMQTIAEGDAGPLDYLSAIPVIGGAARFAKKADKAVDAFGDYKAAYKRTPDSPDVNNKLYDELDFLSPDMDIADFSEEFAYNAERISPQAKRLLNALEKDDWLGFDNPSQALRAVLSEDLDKWEPSQALKSALGTYHNYAGGL